MPANPACQQPTAVAAFRDRQPPKPMPCPACGGQLVLVLIRKRLEIYCSECPWNPDSGDAPDATK